ncbi:MAG TPA: M1 family peptidase, partial [Chitinophagaceae bacterium]|nr:M1 family peptidase [Chitinophagaceae bacterium]
NIDYALANINLDTITNKAILTLKRIGKMPMPIDVLITYKDGSSEMYYIPLNLMYGNKPNESNTKNFVLTEWKWTHPEYTFSINKNINEIKSIEIDPTQRMADINRINNKILIPD